MQYAVTRGNFARSSLPSLAASLLAVGSVMRPNWLYTSLPPSSSTALSACSGFGKSLSFCAVLVVRCGPILGAGCAGSWSAAPELFRLLSLLLSEESMGCPPSRGGLIVAAALVDKDCEGGGKAGRRLGGLAAET